MFELIIKIIFVAVMFLSGAYAVGEFVTQANKFNDTIKEVVK